jgi:hypothetical protein
MRLQYLPEGSSDCPLIRLFDFTPDEARQLALAVADLAAEQIDKIALHEFSYVKAVDECELVLRLRNWDQAVRRIGPRIFECGFTASTWDNVSGLIEPFASGTEGFQWLAGVPGEAALLLTVSGQW